MVDPAFAACFGQVIVEHAQMLRQERQVVFTLRSGAPLDKNLCARLLASLQPDYEGFELREAGRKCRVHHELRPQVGYEWCHKWYSFLYSTNCRTRFCRCGSCEKSQITVYRSHP
jgi:hypothetical protein